MGLERQDVQNCVSTWLQGCVAHLSQVGDAHHQGVLESLLIGWKQALAVWKRTSVPGPVLPLQLAPSSAGAPDRRSPTPGQTQSVFATVDFVAGACANEFGGGTAVVAERSIGQIYSGKGCPPVVVQIDDDLQVEP